MQLSKTLVLLAAAAYAAAIADPAALPTPQQRRPPSTRTQRQLNLQNQQRVRPNGGGIQNVDANGPLGVLGGNQLLERFSTCSQRFTFERCMTAFVSRVSLAAQPNNPRPNPAGA